MLYDLTSTGLLRITGQDAAKLLQGQLTIDIEKMDQDQIYLAAQCNHQGRVISLFYIFQYESDYFLCMPKDMVKIVLASLKKYTIFYKTTIQDESNNYFIFGSYEISCLGPEINHSWLSYVNNPSIKMNIGKINKYETVKETFSQFGQIVGQEEWRYFNIQQGIPSIYAPTSGHFLPHEMNLPHLGVIHFNKGCFTGQEIIVRMHHRAKLKKHLYQATYSTKNAPSPGDIIYSAKNGADNSCGQIVDVCKIQSDLYHLLVLIEDEYINSPLYTKNAGNHNLTIISAQDMG